MSEIELKPCPFCGSKARLMRVGAGRIVKCEGCGDIPGFEGNPFNCVSVKNGSGAVATDKMRQKGTAYCFKSVHQDAGTSELIKEKSFHEMMQDSAKMFS